MKILRHILFVFSLLLIPSAWNTIKAMKGEEKEEKEPKMNVVRLFHEDSKEFVDIDPSLLPFSERLMKMRGRILKLKHDPHVYHIFKDALMMVDLAKKGRVGEQKIAAFFKNIIHYRYGSQLNSNPILYLHAIDLFGYFDMPKHLIEELIIACARAIKGKERRILAQKITFTERPDIFQQTYFPKIVKYYELIHDQTLEIEGMKHPGNTIHDLIRFNKISFEMIPQGLIITIKNLKLKNVEGFDKILKLYKIDPGTIVEVDLSQNQLTQLTVDFLQNCQGLLSLSLQNNQLTKLPDNFLQTCQKLRELSLYNNQLIKLPNNFLQTCQKLQQLNLHNNQLTKLPDNFLQNYPNLQWLGLSINQIKQLPDNFLQNCQKLQKLGLFDNQLTQLPKNFLQKCPNLQELKLHNNQLTKLPDNFLQNYLNLQCLGLHNNQLTKLPDNFLQKCPNLQELWLNNNKLKKLPVNFLHQNKKLQYLIISNNPLPLKETNKLPQKIREKAIPAGDKARRKLEEERKRKLEEQKKKK